MLNGKLKRENVTIRPSLVHFSLNLFREKALRPATWKTSIERTKQKVAKKKGFLSQKGGISRFFLLVKTSKQSIHLS